MPNAYPNRYPLNWLICSLAILTIVFFLQGRLAVKNPNLQTIPHDQEYNSAPAHCTQSTQTTFKHFKLSMRDAFVPGNRSEASLLTTDAKCEYKGDNCVLLSADYSQIEVRYVFIDVVSEHIHLTVIGTV